VNSNVRPAIAWRRPHLDLRRVKSGSVVLFVAGSSIFSRASTAIVLVIAANKLSTAELGLFATLFGVAVAAAYVLASTAGNTLAYWTRANPSYAASTARISLLVSVFGLVLSTVVYLGLGSSHLVATVAGTVLLLIGGVLTTVLMQVLRGLGHLKLAVTAGFVVPSILRLGLSVALIGGPSVGQLLGASSAAAAIGGVVASVAILVVVRRAREVGGGTPYALSIGLSVAAGTVGLMWFLMGQLDLTSLTILRGTEAGGEYAPTMRAFEAMNALGLAVAFVSIRALAGASPEVAVGRIKRIIPPSLALYVALTIPLLLVGHRILDRLLGEKVFWSPAAVLALAIGYGGNLIMALCFETFASQRHTGMLLRVAGQIIVLALLITPLLVAEFGIYGAALGNAISYTAGGVLAYFSLTRLAPRTPELRCAS
jgi:O-antigen/teichoic acid export membrane protein